MALSPGTRLGPYEISAQIGVGGMGQVFRARDTKLDRDVAVKILPEAFAHDADRLARFQREAKTLASLNHPNIATIHGLEESGGMTALVMELVEGDDLSQRIARGAIPLDEALPIAKQIAEALEAAHEQGIVHRDLKPANIKVRPDGTVKVLDFGLAKAMEPAAAMSAGLSQSPIITTPAMTQMGVILGTPAYMSPEQARGQRVERAADVWALACVLYEMLSGAPVFEGETVTDVLGAILMREPKWGALPNDVPHSLQRLLQRCLEKDRRRRLRDAGTVLLELQDIPGEAVDAPLATFSKERWAWIALVCILSSALVGAWIFGRRSMPPASEIRVEINTPPTADEISLVLSPDGQTLAFVASIDDQPLIWLRSLSSVSAKPLIGTEGASYPFWSPDGLSIAFFAGNQLKRIDVAGGPAQLLTITAPGRGGTWNRDGVILFAPTDGPLRQVSDRGGESREVTRVQAPLQSNHRFPHFLPDGRNFLFYVRGAADAEGVYVASLDGSPMRRLFKADAAALYSSGHLFFVRQGALLAQPFDTSRLELTGNPIAIAEHIGVDSNGLGAAFSVSAAGNLAYRTSTGEGQRQLVWFDRTGKPIRRIGTPDTANLLHPELSPDGRHVAIHRNVDGNHDVWLLETARGILNPFTFDPAADDFPVWSPDSRYILFQSNRSGPFNLYRKSTVGAGSEELVLSNPSYKSPTDWSRDGRFALFRMTNPDTGYDLWALPMESDAKPFPVVGTTAEERDGQFSPDGQWVAYQSNESGRFEIYLQAFPKPIDRWRISTTGGTQVRWGRPSSEILYVALDGQLMAVPIRLDSKRQTVDVGTPAVLFRPRLAVSGGSAINRQQYTVSPDGQQFLINTLTEDAIVSPVTLVLNWRPRLEQ